MSMMAILINAAAATPPPTDLPKAPPAALPAGQVIKQAQSGTLSSYLDISLLQTILFFGLVALVLLYLMVRHERAGEFELRIFIVTILVFGSLLVISGGFGNEQLGPVIGFFGTVAGYVLGRGDRTNEPPKVGPKDSPKVVDPSGHANVRPDERI